MPNKQNSQSNVRWGELYPALSALAESEGRPRSEVAREALRAYLKKKRVKAPPRPKLTGADGTRQTIGVRWGSLSEPLIERAIAENTSVSAIARRSVRFFLGHTRVPEIKEHMEEIRRLTRILARIGGNLNQIALAFTLDDILKTDGLAQVQNELIQEFRNFSVLLISIRDELVRQSP